MVERWFRELTEKAIRRGAFKSVPDLIAAIEAYLQVNNNDPKPFVWTATAEKILWRDNEFVGRVSLTPCRRAGANRRCFAFPKSPSCLRLCLHLPALMK